MYSKFYHDRKYRKFNVTSFRTPSLPKNVNKLKSGYCNPIPIDVEVDLVFSELKIELTFYLKNLK